MSIHWEILTFVTVAPGVPYVVKLPTSLPNMTFIRGVVLDHQLGRDSTSEHTLRADLQSLRL